MMTFNPLRYAVVYINLSMIRTFKPREILKYVRLCQMSIVHVIHGACRMA